MHVAARYLPFGDKRAGVCRYLCEGCEWCAGGSSGLSHDDSLKASPVTSNYVLLGVFVRLAGIPSQLC